MMNMDKTIEELDIELGTESNDVGTETNDIGTETEKKGMFDFNIWADVSEGDKVENYIDHALNFNKSKWMGHYILAITSIVGECNKAIFHFFIGWLEMDKELGKSKGVSVIGE